ncbi:helix-turn-helix transcriptional regulator [Silvibacterium sp.]|uniref:helix-turn-helix transcriptional regulator n=1 Tax=Silvibacterium sp. TaxID=1964179 RepID=UPI0039E27798
MSDPIVRIFAVLEVLQSCDSVTGEELAERLEVDLRTVQRYIGRLRDLGIPVSASPGIGGAYRLRPGYRMPPLVFTNEEAFSLSLGLRALHSVGLSAFAPASEGALGKLRRVLPEALRDSLDLTEDVIAMEQRPWVVPTRMESLLEAASAVRASRRVRFSYKAHDGRASRREIEPYAVVHADDRWYLIGRCLSRQALRTFRLDRVAHLEAGAAGFERPEGFDARKHLAESMPFVQSNFQIDVWVDMPLEIAEQSFMFWRIAMEAESGGTRLRCGRDRLEMFAAMLLSMGRRLVIHGPEELRETFQRLAVRALEAASSGV